MADENNAGGQATDPASSQTGGAATGGTPGQSTTATGGEGTAATGGDQSGGEISYTDFTAPEGVVLDGAILDEYKGVAKELKLSQEAAQAVITKMAPKIAAQQQEQMQKTIAETQVQWQQAAKIDKEFGGDNFDANLEVAKKALTTYGSPELKKLMVESGLGNHPEVIRLFYKVGQTLKEDNHVGGTGSQTGEKTLAQRMFG